MYYLCHLYLISIAIKMVMEKKTISHCNHQRNNQISLMIMMMLMDFKYGSIVMNKNWVRFFLAVDDYNGGCLRLGVNNNNHHHI